MASERVPRTRRNKDQQLQPARAFRPSLSVTVRNVMATSREAIFCLHNRYLHSFHTTISILAFTPLHNFTALCRLPHTQRHCISSTFSPFLTLTPPTTRTGSSQPAMRTRAQERSTSAEPGASQQQQTRKRRSSSTSQASTIADEPAIKKTKVAKSHKSTKVSADATHPQLTPVIEEAEQQSSQLDEPISLLPSPPHTTKTTTHRRITISPAALSRASRETSRTRKSLPAQLSGRSYTSAHPLNALVQQRIQLRKEQRRSFHEVPETVEDDFLVTADVDGPSQPSQLQGVAHTDLDGISDKASAVSVADSAYGVKSEHERLMFEDSVKQLYNEAAQAKGALKILTVELQSMGFGQPESDTSAILSSIRKSFEQVRSRLRPVMPLETADNILESTLLVNITDHVLHLDQQNEAKARIITEKEEIERDLLTQVDALVDKLADGEERRNELEQELVEYQTQYDSDAGYIKELQRRLQQVDTDHGKLNEVLAEKIARLEELEQDKDTLDKSCKKLGAALDNYRKEELRLHQLIEKAEQNFKSKTEEANDKHTRETTKLRQHLENEQAGRQKAEGEASDHATQLSKLKDSLAKETAVMEKLRAQIEQLRADYQDVESDKLEAEQIVDTKQATIEGLLQEAEDTGRHIAELEDKYAKLQTLHDSEKRQRESAEAGLDDAQVKVKDLDEKLHKQGVQANELRQKLFEVQQRTQKTIEGLENDLATHQAQSEKDMADETARRQTAEDLADFRQEQIVELERQLAEVEADMEKALDDKESVLQSMEERAINLEDELDKNKALLKKKIAEHTTLKKDTTEQIHDLHRKIRDLEQNIVDQEDALTKIRDSAELQQDQMNATLHSRDTTINTLQTELGNNRHLITDLENAKASLERRVEDEAESMLTEQNRLENMIAGLRNAMVTKDKELNDLARKATDNDTAYQTTLSTKDTTITELQATVTDANDKLQEMHRRNAHLRELFHAYAEKATGKMDDLYEQIATLKNSVNEDATTLEKDAQAILAKMDEDLFVVPAIESAEVEQVDAQRDEQQQQQVVKAGKKKGGRRVTGRRIRDSGIGVSSDFEPQAA